MPRLSLKDVLENDPEAYYEKSELLEPLKVMYRSLIATDDTYIANGRLLDVIRQINCFGLGMVQLDIRQESTRHANAIDEITRYIGLGSYKYCPIPSQNTAWGGGLSASMPSACFCLFK